jgi:hypothetical protein
MISRQVGSYASLKPEALHFQQVEATLQLETL